MIRLQSKQCPACGGSGYRSAAPDDNCRKCKGAGRIPGSVKRIVNAPGEPRPLVVDLREDGVYIREQGRRTVYGPLSYGALFLAGARQYVTLRNIERKGRRASAKSARRAKLTRGR